MHKGRQYFYVLRNPEFKSKLGFEDDIPPPQQRALRPDGSDACQHVQLFYATSPGWLRGILAEAKLQPFRLRHADSG